MAEKLKYTRVSQAIDAAAKKGHPLVTHVAAHHARIAVVKTLLFRATRKVDYRAVPWVTFTDPELGGFGLTEHEARQRWETARRSRRSITPSSTVRSPLTSRTDLPSWSATTNDGWVGRPWPPAAGETIAELAAWVSSRAPIDRVSQTAHAYRTLSEGPVRAADEHLRRRLGTASMRTITRAALAASCTTDRLR